jgi:hypothetical protein
MPALAAYQLLLGLPAGRSCTASVIATAITKFTPRPRVVKNLGPRPGDNLVAKLTLRAFPRAKSIADFANGLSKGSVFEVLLRFFTVLIPVLLEYWAAPLQLGFLAGEEDLVLAGFSPPDKPSMLGLTAATGAHILDDHPLEEDYDSDADEDGSYPPPAGVKAEPTAPLPSNQGEFHAVTHAYALSPAALAPPPPSRPCAPAAVAPIPPSSLRSSGQRTIAEMFAAGPTVDAVSRFRPSAVDVLAAAATNFTQRPVLSSGHFYTDDELRENLYSRMFSFPLGVGFICSVREWIGFYRPDADRSAGLTAFADRISTGEGCVMMDGRGLLHTIKISLPPPSEKFHSLPKASPWSTVNTVLLNPDSNPFLTRLGAQTKFRGHYLTSLSSIDRYLENLHAELLLEDTPLLLAQSSKHAVAECLRCFELQLQACIRENFGATDTDRASHPLKVTWTYTFCNFTMMHVQGVLVVGDLRLLTSTFEESFRRWNLPAKCGTSAANRVALFELAILGLDMRCPCCNHRGGSSAHCSARCVGSEASRTSAAAAGSSSTPRRKMLSATQEASFQLAKSKDNHLSLHTWIKSTAAIVAAAPAGTIASSVEELSRNQARIEMQRAPLHLSLY